ncbi:MAG: ATP-binding protein [Patescibacteria group bacterium]|nr:ATP-binding protein [Patescibacteria group bacterium]
MLLYLTTLYIICAVLMLGMGILSLKVQAGAKSNQCFFCFAVASAFWMIFLYLGYYFVEPYQPENVDLFIKLAYGFSLIPPFFIAKFFYDFPKKVFVLPRAFQIAELAILIALFCVSSFTGLIHKYAVVENGIYIKDTFGKLYILYTVYFFFYFIFSFYLIYRKKPFLDSIQKKKIMISAAGLLILLSLTVLTNVILPIFNIFIFQQETIIFILLFGALTFYAIVKYRFLDIQFTVTQTLKKTLALAFAAVAACIIYWVINKFLVPNKIDAIWLNLISLILAIFLYNRINVFFSSSIFHKFFGITNIEHFKRVISDFRNGDMVYFNLKNLKNSLKQAFCDELRISFAEVVIINRKNRDQYKLLIKKCLTLPEILITKEIQFKRNEDKSKYLFINDLVKLGEVCLPLFSLSNHLLGFLVLGKKFFDDPYSSEEIKAIEQLQFFLGIELTSILYKSQLNEEIMRKTKDLKKMLDQQHEFIATSSHELRTPLNIALRRSEMLLDDIESLPGTAKRDLLSMNNSLEQIRRLLQQLFELQQVDMDKAKLFLQVILARDFFKEIRDEFAPLFEKRQIALKIVNKLDNDAKIEIDVTRLRQVMNNLLTNAMKFAENSSEIELDISKPDKKKAIILSVADHGPGISNKDKQKIFTKFYGDNSNKGKGLGLGLYICQQIVKMHKGKIWVEDNLGGGAIFKIEMPVLV